MVKTIIFQGARTIFRFSLPFSSSVELPSKDEI